MKLGKLLLKGMLRKPRSVERRVGGPSSGSRGVRRIRSSPVARISRTQALSRVRKTNGAEILDTGNAEKISTSQRPELQAGSLLRPSDSLKSTMEAFLLDQRSEHTRTAYGKDLKRFFKFLLIRGRADLINRGLIIAYKESLLAEGLQHTTVDRHLATLRSFFGWLFDEGWMSVNPADGVRFLNPKRLSKTIGFTDEEVRRVLAIPDLHTRTGSLHYAALMMLFHCGLRRSELCSLRTTNLGKERGHTVVRLQGKGNAERVIVIVPPVWNALQHYFRITRKDPAKDQYLFSPLRNNRTGTMEKPLDSSMIFYIVTRYAKLAGVANRVSPHSCRATAISNARDRNVPDRAIQEFAGWSTPDMITRYDKRKNAVEKSAAHSIQYGASDRALEDMSLLSRTR